MWAEKYLKLHPETGEPMGIHAEPLAVRGTWVEIFNHVIDSRFADSGIIQISPKLGYSDDQLAEMFNMDVRTWTEHKARLVVIGEIQILEGNRIYWVRWPETQPEYDRQKQYRSNLGYNDKLLDKREERRESKKRSLLDVPNGTSLSVSRQTPPKDEVVLYWNGKGCLPLVRSLSGTRLTKLRARWRLPEFQENWREAVDSLAGSKFHLGENDRGWKATIDWFLANDANWCKCWERKITDGVRQTRTKEQIEAGERARLEREEQEEAAKRGDMTPAGKALAEKLTGIVKGGTDAGCE
jgi:hypothetical protein